jgi:glycosyltransferase involved in cell wall biosynthesis/CDP-glycerol glycerophosphotransferase (TagB/SpsB family)
MKKLKTIRNMIWHSYSMNKKNTDSIEFISKQSKEVSKKTTDIEKLTRTLVGLQRHNKNLEQNKVKFSVVSACYNNYDYLDDYFRSFLKQKNPENIQIIIVDDGSTDETKQKIINWQEKKLLNIEYIYQENAGQSIARNNGLKFITNEWCTFIDTDDFISDNYFSEIAKEIIANENAKKHVYVSKWVMYYENDNSFKNHILNSRFGKHNTLINIEEKPEYVNFGVTNTIFNNSLIKGYDLEFRSDVKPNFEDGYFYLEYVNNCDVKNIMFMANTKYFYRKRHLANSTIDSSRQDPNRYNLLLQTGYLRLINSYNNQNVKMTLLYDLRWNIESFDELENKTDKLINEREELLDKIFKNIKLQDIQYALSKDLISRFFAKYLVYKYYPQKDSSLYEYKYMNENIDSFKVGVICTAEEFEKLYFINSLNINVDTKNFERRKKIVYKINDFILYEYIITVDKNTINIEKIYMDQECTSITRMRTNYQEKSFSKDSTILFFDRKDKADDNAEELYRYFMAQKPEFKNIYFILEKSSNDWDRLMEDGFNLVDYNSNHFDKLYNEGDFIFSSGGDSASIENFKRYRYFWYKSNIKFIFLQHGIIKDDLKDWLFAKKYDKIIATGKKETTYLSKEVFFENDVLPTGLPRYDYLLKNKDKPKDKIVLSFTWRLSLQNVSKDSFRSSSYYTNINNLLKKMENISDYEVILIAHPNSSMLVELLQEENHNVQIKTAQEVIYKEIISETKLFITDYSSLAFDMAIAGASILYYQFDKSEFYSGHTYCENEELFSYENDGFGPVFYNEKEISTSLLKISSDSILYDELYEGRKNNFFNNIDTNNCQRLFDSMVEEYGK